MVMLEIGSKMIGRRFVVLIECVFRIESWWRGFEPRWLRGRKNSDKDDHEAEDVHHRVAGVEGQGKQSREVGDGLYETR